MESRRVLSVVVWMIFSLGVAGCGESGQDAVARSTGTLTGEVQWSGTWPETGKLLLALFASPPWDPGWAPGPPSAYRYLEKGEGHAIAFALDNPPIAFGEYGALMIAWKDPQEPDPRKQMHVVSAYGTTVDELASAQSIVLEATRPDWVDLEMPPMTLFLSAADMRTHFPSL